MTNKITKSKTKKKKKKKKKKIENNKLAKQIWILVIAIQKIVGKLLKTIKSDQ